LIIINSFKVLNISFNGFNLLSGESIHITGTSFIEYQIVFETRSISISNQNQLVFCFKKHL